MNAQSESLFDRVREGIVIGILTILIGFAVYSILGFAWTFKIMVESSQKLTHPFSRAL